MPSQEEWISPKLQEAVQSVRSHKLAEGAWRWTRRLMMAPLRNHPKRRKISFSQDKGISAKLKEAVQPVHVHELAEGAWRWTRCLVMAPLRNHTETKENSFSRQRDEPQTPF